MRLGLGMFVWGCIDWGCLQGIGGIGGYRNGGKLTTWGGVYGDIQQERGGVL